MAPPEVLQGLSPNPGHPQTPPRQPSMRRRVHYAEAPPGSPGNRQTLMQLTAQGKRILAMQRRWQRIKDDLPPQLSRRHIGMISIGGVIGTGLFVGSADALYHGGPVGALLGYSIIGSVVYCLCVSIGEMIAFLPNVGGVVGLADLYVDPALGFSLGWAAWYNWSVTLPAEITAAAIVIGFWDKHHIVNPAKLSALFLALATAINCFSSRVYGECEFWFAATKALTIIFIIGASFLIDVGVGGGRVIGLSNWKPPFAESYYGVSGATGRLLGFWAVLMQASFSFFGSEVPGIAAGEVIDATRNVPRALQRVWLRITLFYIGGILAAGLLVNSSDPDLRSNEGTTLSSPFVIAFKRAKADWLAHIINAAVLLSAWSAAASDVYISSRFLFFLARCNHAPQIFAFLFRYPSSTPDEPGDACPESDIDASDDEADGHDGGVGGEVPLIDVEAASAHSPDHIESSYKGSQDEFYEDVTVTVVPAPVSSVDDVRSVGGPTNDTIEPVSEDIERATRKPKQPWFVLPFFAVIGSASVGMLSFLSTLHSGGTQAAFVWLVAVASVASLQSWAAMLFTYIRWHQGTVYAENKHRHDAEDNEASRKIIRQIEKIKVHRHRGQPYLAWYALILCLIILLTNGLSVFIHNDWRIANIPNEPPKHYGPGNHRPNAISTFLSSYVPIPFFLLLTFGYKLIHQTKMIKLEDMDFSRGDVNEEEQKDPVYSSTCRRILGWLLVN